MLFFKGLHSVTNQDKDLTAGGTALIGSKNVKLVQKIFLNANCKALCPILPHKTTSK